MIPKPGQTFGDYDLMLASQPWRARMSAKFKAREGARAARAQPGAPGPAARDPVYGRDPALEIVQQLWPDEDPFQVDRHELLAALRDRARPRARATSTSPSRPTSESIFRYEMHTLPSEIGDRIGTSTLFAAWNAAIYVNQIEDERLDAVVTTGAYLEATQAVLQKHGGLWFNDETFVVARRP